MSNGDGTIRFDAGTYGAAQGADHAPNPTVPDPLPTPGSPIDAALAVYHAAANGDDPANDAELAGLYGDRETQYGDNLAKFPASEDQKSAEMAKAFPEIISAVAGAVTGAIGGLVAPLTQIPQAAMQAGQGALQTGMGALQQQAGDTSGDLGSIDDESLLADDPSMYDDLSSLYGDTGGGGGGTAETGGGGTGNGGTGTDPTSSLAPPPVISTYPAAAAPPVPSTPAAPTGPPAPSAGMGGMPYMPMAGAGGAAAGTNGTDDKKEQPKKVVPPVIKNSRAVNGRLPGTRRPETTTRQTGVGSLSSRTARRQQETPAANNDEGGAS